MSDDVATLGDDTHPLGTAPRAARTRAAGPLWGAGKRGQSPVEWLAAAAIKQGYATREQIADAMIEGPYAFHEDGPTHPGEHFVRSGVLTMPQVASLLAVRATGYRLFEDSIRLATVLQPALAGERRTVMVAGVATRSGSADLVAGIAVALAFRQERATTLIDCDVKQPALHRLFGIEVGAGTLAMLAGQQSAVVRPQHTGLPGLSVVPCEADGGSAGSWLDEAAVTRLLGLGGQGVTLLSAAPILTDPHALALARRADATLLVVPSNGCRRAELAEATRLLGLAGAHMLGVVMTRDGR